MNNINLLESAQGGGSAKKIGLGIKSLSIPIIVLVFVFAIWGGMEFYSNYLLGQKNKIDEMNKMEKNALKGESVNRVVDFEERMKKSESETSSKNNYEEYLKDLEGIMVPGSMIESLKYGEKIEVTLVADNFQTIARQILGFKNSKYFKDIQMDKTSREESGKIKYSLIK